MLKFSELDKESWEELHLYLDTCLIPVTGLTGTEAPYEVVEALERLRDMMDLVEVPFKGRVVTYPSFQYGNEEITEFINEICHNVKRSGFKYVIVISADVDLNNTTLNNADLVLIPSALTDFSKGGKQQAVHEKIQGLWQQKNEL
ncbi:hypothetical protein D3C76_675560 [compost metagenome]